MTQTIPDADIRGYYHAIGVTLPAWATGRTAARCIADDLAPPAKTTIFDIDQGRERGYDLTGWILDGHVGTRDLDLTHLSDSRRAHGR